MALSIDYKGAVIFYALRHHFYQLVQLHLCSHVEAAAESVTVTVFWRQLPFSCLINCQAESTVVCYELHLVCMVIIDVRSIGVSLVPRS